MAMEGTQAMLVMSVYWPHPDSSGIYLERRLPLQNIFIVRIPSWGALLHNLKVKNWFTVLVYFLLLG